MRNLTNFGSVRKDLAFGEIFGGCKFGQGGGCHMQHAIGYLFGTTDSSSQSKAGEDAHWQCAEKRKEKEQSLAESTSQVFAHAPLTITSHATTRLACIQFTLAVVALRRIKDTPIVHFHGIKGRP
jgi:hypothetical protein